MRRVQARFHCSSSPTASEQHTQLYRLLGVSVDAPKATIRAAYRHHAAQLHPDTNKSVLAHEKFQVTADAAHARRLYVALPVSSAHERRLPLCTQAMNLAYSVLCDEQLRAVYDVAGISALGSEYRQLHQLLQAGRRHRPRPATDNQPAAQCSAHVHAHTPMMGSTLPIPASTQ